MTSSQERPPYSIRYVRLLREGDVSVSLRGMGPRVYDTGEVPSSTTERPQTSYDGSRPCRSAHSRVLRPASGVQVPGKIKSAIVHFLLI